MPSIREYIIVGGGIASVEATEELCRLLATHTAASTEGNQIQQREQRKSRRYQLHNTQRQNESNNSSSSSSSAAVSCPSSSVSSRVTLLHGGGSTIQRVSGSVQRTPLLEEITSVEQMEEDQFIQRVRKIIANASGMDDENLSKETILPIELRIIRGTLTSLDMTAKQIVYLPSDNPAIQHLRYDKLCLCTGARPSLFVETPVGVTLPPQVLFIRDAASLNRLSAALAEPVPDSQKGRAKRVAIVGNGGIAIELVHALRTGQLSSINASDAVASNFTATATKDATPAVPLLPPLQVEWIVKHEFLCSPFLDRMSSAFLLPELFPHSDPPMQQQTTGTRATADDKNTAVSENGAITATPVCNVTEEERIAGVVRGQHVHTEITGDVRMSDDAASVATRPVNAASPVAAGASVSGALGPTWLSKLYSDTNIPKYVLERERAKTAAIVAASSQSEPGSASTSLPPFDLSLQLCMEVVELQVHPDSDFPLSLRLSNGHTLSCDLVISATGVRANTEWAPIDLKCGSKEDGGGIIINECMETSIPDIYAAGDCSTLRFSSTFLSMHTDVDHPLLFHQQRLWSHAKLLGCYAARAMSNLYTDELTELGGFNFLLFTHSTVLLGRKTVLLGLHNLQTLGGPNKVGELVHSGKLKTLVRCKPDNREELIKLHLFNGRLIGALLIGTEESEAVELEETCENLMINQTDLTPFGDFLNDVNIDLADFFD
jgi:NADH dehydrogenase FAD-containing subunit